MYEQPLEVDTGLGGAALALDRLSFGLVALLHLPPLNNTSTIRSRLAS